MSTVMKPPRLCYRAFEFRNTSEDGDGLTLEGYAAVFNDPTRIDSWEGVFDEQIRRGAFKRTIKARTPVMQFDHGNDARTGSVPIASIDKLHEDDHGLFVRARLFDNDVVAPIRDAIAGGAIDGMSFRFRVVNDHYTEAKDRDESDIDLREITEVELFELGPVVFPAYDSTSVGVRSLLAHLDQEQRERLIVDLADTIRSEDSPEEGPDEDPEEDSEESEEVEEDAEPEGDGDSEQDSDEESEDPDDETDPPSRHSVPDSEPNAGPSSRHSALYGSPPSWHLPPPSISPE